MIVRDSGMPMWHRYGPNMKGNHMRHLITLGCLLVAIILYATGDKPTAGLVLLGAAFECAFWIRLVRRPRPP